ncbi:MAG TPA: NADH-quinone oxidoreductase subunit N [Methanosarcinales archaeon]|nr:NADH-quinone oxidoreductase subunit N [Methanosarcinales archaeon]
MNYMALLPEGLLIGFAVLVLLVGLITSQKKILGYITLVGLLLSLGLIIKDWNLTATFADAPLYGAIVVDPFSQIFGAMFLIVGVLVCIAALEGYGKHPRQDEFYSLMLLATVGMMVVAMSKDLLALFIGFELASIATYAMAGFDKRDPRSIEAALKYFLIGGLSSSLMVFGISYLYGLTGATHIDTIASVFAASPGLAATPAALFAIVLLIAGFGFKMAFVPFHMWAPDTYEGAPSIVSALLAAGSKKMGFAAAFRVFIIGLVAMKLDWYIAFMILAIVTMTVGNVLAVVQKSVKRMLAYSSIAHAGYIAIVFVIVAYYKAPDAAVNLAVTGGLMHAFSHAIGKAGAFIAVAAIGYMIMSKDGVDDPNHVDNYDGLGKRAPLTALLFALLLCSLAGIPPLFGFTSKFVLFLSSIEAGLLGLAIICVLNSALSVYYYAKVVMRMYWGEPRGEAFIEPSTYVFVMAIAVIALIALFAMPDAVYYWAEAAAHAVTGV